MPAGTIVLGIAAGVAILSGLGYFAHVQNKKRNEAMALVAQTMGFDFQLECGPAELESYVGALPLFEQGHSHRARRVMRGKLAGRDVLICDYSYTTGSGKHRHIHHQTPLVFPQAGSTLPDFTLAPENFMHRIGQVFGFQDIDFPTHPDFSKNYLLRGADEDGIRRACTGDFLSLMGGMPGWCVQSQSGRLAVFREGKYAQPAEVPSYAADALRIVGSLRG